jgi:hypothetical protein
VDFKQAEIKFKQLKVQFETGKLTEAEFKTQLEGLMVQDESGSWWMIGYETELWYRHDGENWIQTDVPGNLPKKPKSLVPTEHKETESKSSEKAPREKAERETAEKAAKEKAEREATEKAAKEKLEREAAEKAAREKAHREVAEKARKEVAEQTYWEELKTGELRTKPSYWKAIGYHLLLGFGLFYIDKAVKRKWLYPIIVFYAIMDIFLASQYVSPFEIAEFGGTTFFISLGIYVLSFLDVILTCKAYRKNP